ncbi:uncharacterized protein [Malus domestica]|uniref:uncharacterized protein n=1 Tax=Malus domestica TaxID=3750 RepID=UPI0010AA0959|nr:uncharacterized protein LOC108170658 [Malus domestica]
MRDYSQIFSNDAKRPAPAKDCPPKNVSLPNSGVRSNRISMKSKHPLESNGRKAPTSGKIDSKSMGTRKQLDRNESGSGRPLGSNGLPLKMSASTTERKTSASGAKTSDDEHDPEAGNVRDVIRKMFRALIARREDEEQARLIEAEEGNERPG